MVLFTFIIVYEKTKGDIDMTLGEKLEVLIHRKGISKTDFADKIGITYRGLANYINGSRSPKKAVLQRISRELGVDENVLLDEKRSLILDSRERFIINASKNSTGIKEASELLEHAQRIFDGRGLTVEDKQALFSCLTEVYFSSKK